MQLDDLPGDGETKTEAAVLARQRTIRLTEAIEHIREKGRINSVAEISNSDQNGCLRRFLQRDVDAPTRRRELHRIRQEVPHRLLKTIRIAHHHFRRWFELCRDIDALDG